MKLSTSTPNAPFVIGITGSLDEAQMRGLIAGERVVLPVEHGRTLRVVFDTSIYDYFMRPILSAQLRFESNTAIMTFELGEDYFQTAPNPQSRVTSTLEIRGQIPVGCALVPDGNLVADPSWSSEFCQTARTDLGLDAWINAML